MKSEQVTYNPKTNFKISKSRASNLQSQSLIPVKTEQVNYNPKLKYQ